MEIGYIPDFFIPFNINQEKAIFYFKDFMKQRKAPKKSYDDENIMSIVALYVPTYYFSSNINAKVNALYHYHRTNSSSIYYPVDMETTLKIYNIQGTSVDFNKDEIRGLGKFDINDALIFDPDTFKGIVSKVQNIDAAKIEEEMKIDALLEINNEILRRERADKFLYGNIKIDFKNIQRKSLLIPIWILKIKYNGKIFSYLINGQTGQIYSKDIPVSIINHIKSPLKSILKWCTITGVLIGAIFSIIALIARNSDISFYEILMITIGVFMAGMWHCGIGLLIFMLFSVKDLKKTELGERVHIAEKNEKYYNNKKNGYNERMIPVETQIVFSSNGKDMKEKNENILKNIKVERRCK